MAIYVVMESGETRAANAGHEVYIRDSFSLIAFLVPVVWLLWHRLWIEALLVFAAGMVLGAIGQALDVNAGVAIILSLLIGLYVGLEGPALRIAALGRRGWREWGVVKANNQDEAEVRYLIEVFTDAKDEAEPEAPKVAEPRTRPATVGPALGLLDYPGSR